MCKQCACMLPLASFHNTKVKRNICKTHVAQYRRKFPRHRGMCYSNTIGYSKFLGVRNCLQRDAKLMGQASAVSIPDIRWVSFLGLCLGRMPRSRLGLCISRG